jgi:lipoprotein-releasing system permease protein
VATLIVVLSVMIGAGVEMRDRILGMSPHIDIQGPGDTLTPWRQWLDQVEKLPGVRSAKPYVSSQVMVTRGSRVAGAILKGVDVGREMANGNLAAYMTHGNLADLESGPSPFRVVMGKGLARKLGVTIGDRVNLLSPAAGVTPMGAAPRLRSFEVVGVFDSGFYEYDIGMIVTPIAAVQALRRIGDSVSGIELYLDERDAALYLANEARAVLPPGAWITTWMQRHNAFFKALKMERVVMGVILFLIVIVAVFNMVASLVMVVMERKREIAILKTVGATDAAVMRIFLYMGGMLTGLGTLSGLGFGLLLAWKLDALLAWLERVTGVTFMSGEVYYIDHVPSIIDPGAVTMIVVASLCLGLAATFYPAWRAAKLPPADVLRYE